MPHRLALAAIAVSLATAAPCARAVEHDFNVLAELQIDTFDAARSWSKRGLGKLRDGDAGDDKASQATLRGVLDYRAQFTDTLGAQLVFDAYMGEDTNGGITEGWITWSPVPQSAWQQRVRAGIFIPPFSLEHTGTGWTSPYMPTASVLNSWAGEELHVTGAEFTLRRLGAIAGSPHTVTLRAGAFTGNDTAGTVLSWRGWVVNDRVTRRGDLLPLPDRAVFRPGGTFEGLHDSDPFVELDDRAGYYLAGEWRYGDRVKLVAGHYDNRADPLAFEDGQAGWRTRFQMAGAHIRPERETDLLFQYAAGNTFVGQRGSVFSVDNDFSAWYLLASRRFGRHQFSARIEGFDVTDEDPNHLDDNREDGDVRAIAWQFDILENLRAGVEILAVHSTRPERALIDLPVEETERQLRLLLRVDF